MEHGYCKNLLVNREKRTEIVLGLTPSAFAMTVRGN
jgi:hypothetical protein